MRLAFPLSVFFQFAAPDQLGGNFLAQIQAPNFAFHCYAAAIGLVEFQKKFQLLGLLFRNVAKHCLCPFRHVSIFVHIVGIQPQPCA